MSLTHAWSNTLTTGKSGIVIRLHTFETVVTMLETVLAMWLEQKFKWTEKVAALRSMSDRCKQIKSEMSGRSLPNFLHAYSASVPLQDKFE